MALKLGWNRDTVAKYHKLALKLGLFEVTGKRHGRVMGMNVAIPSEIGVRLALGESGTGHSGSPRDCPLCEPYALDTRYVVNEVVAFHEGGSKPSTILDDSSPW